MEYHYSDLCVMPADLPLTGPYTSEYVQPYLLQPQGEAEYEVRNTVLVDGGDRFGVSAAVFDKSEELVWMGNQGGHVTSYYGPAMQKYTSFQIHESEEVRDIITADEGIYALTKTTLRHQLRRGIPKFTYKSPNMTDMQCLYQPRTNKLIMGGHQDKLLEFDLGVQKEIVVPITEDGCAVLRSGGGTVVACGSANGTVTLRDLRCPGRAQQTINAHTACLSDLDMQGNLLITCGFTQSSLGVAQAEPYVVVWDVRKVRNGGTDSGAWTAPTASVPLLLHFVPAFSGRAVAVAGDGHVTLLHVNSPSDEQSVFQVDTQNSLCSVMDVSSTSQGLIFGDQSGHLHLFSPQHNHEPVFNNFSRETEFAEPVVGLPYVPFTDSTFQFSTIPHPSLQPGGSGRYFNQLPDNFFLKHYRKPKPIDPEVLKTIKMQGPIGYAPNPRTFRRNQMPYLEDTLEDLSPKNVEFKVNSAPIPRHYQKLDIRVNKNGPNDEMDNFNKTGFPGLESTLPNSYCNAMLQVLYYTAAVKATLLAHTCAKEFCLSCELGFLFRMLDTSGGAPCQATNFLRAFRTVPEAAALGLILPDRGPEPRVDLVSLVQSWNRFILHQMHSDIVETRKKEKELSLIAQNQNSPKVTLMNHHNKLGASPVFNGKADEGLEFLGPSRLTDGLIDGEWGKGHDEGISHMEGNPQAVDLSSNHNDNEESEITELFAIVRHQLNRCLKCNKEEERESVVLACALQYPPPSAIKDAAVGEVKGGFVDLLLASLAISRSTPAWCDNCSRFSPTLQQGRAIRLPPILAINCGGVTAHEKSFWAKTMQKEPEVIRRGPTSKPCRYGLHCARPGCRFRHPDRPGSSLPSSPVKEAECMLPHQLSIRLSADGDIFINDKTEPSNESTQNGKQRRKRFKPIEEEYSLSAAVICVEDNPRNLVAYVKKGGTEEQPHWYLINDLCIQPVPAEEVVHYGSWWKSACVLLYTSRNVTAPPPPPPAVAS